MVGIIEIVTIGRSTGTDWTTSAYISSLGVGEPCPDDIA